MSTTAVTIANIALGHLGIGITIASLTERNKEARTANRFYEPARNYVQNRYPWKNGLRRADLAELATNDWDDEFLYAYTPPADCRWLRRICIGQGTAQKGPVFRVVSNADGKVILTDTPEANVEYSVLVEDPEMWDDEQVQATAYKLAAMMARTFDEDNASGLMKDMEQLAEIEISRAAARDYNQEEPPEPPRSEFETCRR